MSHRQCTTPTRRSALSLRGDVWWRGQRATRHPPPACGRWPGAEVEADAVLHLHMVSYDGSPSRTATTSQPLTSPLTPKPAVASGTRPGAVRAPRMSTAAQDLVTLLAGAGLGRARPPRQRSRASCRNPGSPAVLDGRLPQPLPATTPSAAIPPSPLSRPPPQIQPDPDGETCRSRCTATIPAAASPRPCACRRAPGQYHPRGRPNGEWPVGHRGGGRGGGHGQLRPVMIPAAAPIPSPSAWPAADGCCLPPAPRPASDTMVSGTVLGPAAVLAGDLGPANTGFETHLIPDIPASSTCSSYGRPETLLAVNDIHTADGLWVVPGPQPISVLASPRLAVASTATLPAQSASAPPGASRQRSRRHTGGGVADHARPWPAGRRGRSSLPASV
jgi:hypothetical protein